MISFIIEWSTANWLNLAFAALVATVGLILASWLISAVAATAVTLFGRREMRKVNRQSAFGDGRSIYAKRSSPS